GPGGHPPAPARVRQPHQGRRGGGPAQPHRDLGPRRVGALHPRGPGRLLRGGQRRPPRRAGDLMVLTSAPTHQPVMVDRCVELLRPRGDGVWVDATLGLGGHAEALLQASEPAGRVVGLDRDLARVLRDYGEERFAGRIARFVEQARRRAPLRTTGELVELVKAAVPAAARRGGPHPARRTFQALRIEVNGELDALRTSLPQAIDLLAPGGRVVVLSYHSLEDRIVKQTFAAAAGRAPAAAGRPLPVAPPPARLALLTRRPETPGAAEVAANPRAESAKLRAAEKLAGRSATAADGHQDPSGAEGSSSGPPPPGDPQGG